MKYHIYKIKKPNGKFRIIHAPQGELKVKQKLLAKKLNAIYEPPSCVYGYVNGRSAADLAKCHLRKDWVITIDIKDFFPSIKSKMLSTVGLTEEEIETATYKGKCVQGSACSPVISNMILETTDKQMSAMLGGLHDVTYTRYSDDIQLSGMGKPKWKYIQLIKNVLAIDGFKINEEKIKFMFKNQRQEVLGICVNDKVSVDRKVRSQLKFRAKRGMLDATDIGMISYVNGVMK
jgi:RNA-directed DNA polymerase